MYKVVWLARFPPGSDRADMSRYWTEEHGPRFARVPGVKRYVQNHTIAPISATGASDVEIMFDGYSCAWFTSEAAFNDAMKSPEWINTVEDGVNVFDMEWLWGKSAVLNEYIMRGEPSHFAFRPEHHGDLYKVVWFVKFREDKDRSDYRDYWRNHHGPLALREPLMLGYTQNHVVSGLGADGASDDPVEFDGMSESWFADEASFLNAMNTPAWLELVEDGDNLFDMEYLWKGMSGVLDERVIVP